MRSARSVFLGVMSICGSVAAAVWFATSGVASAETLAIEEPVFTQDGVVISKTRIVDQPPGLDETTPKKRKKKRIDFGAFEGY